MQELNKFFSDLAKRPESTRELAEIAGISQKGAWLYKAGKIRNPQWRIVVRLMEYMAAAPLAPPKQKKSGRRKRS